MTDICLLGTSALLPLPDRALTAAALTRNGRTILFDCGEGTQTQARSSGISLMKTDMIALTHYHGDHIFGLPGMMQTMFCLGRREPLYITGPAGLERELAPIMKLAGGLSYDVNLISLSSEPLKLNSILPHWDGESFLEAFRTNHRTESQGYCYRLERVGKFMPEKAKALDIPVTLWSRLQKGQRVEVEGNVFYPEQVMGKRRKGLKFVFTGDTAPCDEMIEAAKGADLMICDSTYAEDEHTDIALERGHMTFALAADCAAKAGVKKLWLSHYSQLVKEPEEYLNIAQSRFENTECGFDGKKTTLYFKE